MQLLLAIVSVLIILGLLRFLYLASRCGKDLPPLSKKRTTPCRTLIVIGSGGHTAEMLRLLGGMDLENYAPRVYVIAEGDKMSTEKVEKFESAVTAVASTSIPTTESSSSAPQGQGQHALDIRRIPRARQVMQSYITSVFSTLIAIMYSLPIVISASPELVLCNGPGTCIPVCFWAYVMKFFGLKNLKIIYVESVCRVEHLSLSGILLYYLFMADYVFVQWPQLQQKYPRTTFIGRIV